MKLKSKNSFLKRIACIVLSAMLCLTSFTLAGFAPTLEAEAATSKEVLHYTFNSSISDVATSDSASIAYKNIDKVKKTYDNVYTASADASFMNSVIYGRDFGGSVQKRIDFTGQDTYHYSKVHSLTNSVALYTGTSSDIRIPVTYEHLYGKVDGSKTALTYRYLYTGIDHIYMSESNFALGQKMWERCDGWDNLTYYNGKSEHTTLDFYSDEKTFERSEGSNYSDHRFTEKSGTSNNKYWRNYIKYTGSGNTDKYYDKLSTPTFNYQADYVYSYYVAFGGWKYLNMSNYQTTFNSGLNVYVLNFAPLLQIMNSQDFKTNFETIYKNSWMYDDTAIKNYFDVMADITTFDITTYPMTDEIEVSQVARKIKDLVDRYKKYKSPAKKKITVVFDRTIGDDVTTTIEAGNSIGEFPKNSDPTTELGFEDQGHNKYTWDTTLKADSIPTSDVTIMEKSQLVAHSYGQYNHTYEDNKNYDAENADEKYKHSRKCTICEYETSSEDCTFTNQGVSGDTATVKCSVCNGTYTLDYTAYNDELEVLDSMLAQTAKYSNTVDCKKDRDTVDDSATAPDILTQAQVNEKIAELKDIENKLTIATYTVTFNTVDGDDGRLDKVSETAYTYGSVATLKTTDVSPYKWMIGDNKVATATDEFSLVVTGDVTVNAHYVSQSDSTTEQHLVTVYNRQNKIVGYLYVNNGATLTVTAGEISDGITNVKPEKPPFYQITGYTVEDGRDANGYTVTSDIKVYPNYSAQPTIEITLGTSTTPIYFSNDSTKSVNKKTVVWDEKVVVNADKDVIWLVNEKPVAKGTSYTFRASASIKITAKAVENETPSSVITYAEFDADNNKARLAVSNYSSDKYNIKEQGIYFGTTSNMSATFTSEELAQKGKKYVATKTTDTGNQFSYTLTFTSKTQKKLCVISYVVYDDGTTVYSDKVTYVTIN